MAAPWTWRARSEQRNSASAAMSSGLPKRRMLLWASASSRSCSTVLPSAAARCSSSCCRRSVSVLPGWMTFTLTSSRLPSLDRPLEKLATAALTDPPIRNSASGVRAAPPTMLTTLPCAAFSSGQNSRVSRTQPKNFSAEPSSQAASGSSRNAPARVAPALLTSTSQRRNRSLTSPNSRSQASSRRRSPATVNGCGPAAATALAAAARFCSDEEASTVCAPSRAKARAMPRPMPRLPPEMTTILSLNSPDIPTLPAGRFVQYDFVQYYYAGDRRGNSAAMKSIFVDCNNQLAPVFARVLRPDDPPIAVNTERFQSADLPRLLAGYDVCLDDHSYLPTEAMAECRALKHIVFLGTGASSYMDVPALNSLGITVHTIKGYGDTAVAEHAIALLFACCRELARMDRGVRAGVWDPLESMQLKGKTLGLIGLGGVGAEVARIACGIDMEVIAWNRSPRPQAGVPMVGLDELLALADVISLHLALTEETRGVIDAARLARMKPGVILVNTARGALVEETALIDALRSGHIRHAGLDVFHAEPLRPDHPLAQLENVTLTAHAGFRTLEASETLMRRAIDIVGRIAAPAASTTGSP